MHRPSLEIAAGWCQNCQNHCFGGNKHPLASYIQLHPATLTFHGEETAKKHRWAVPGTVLRCEYFGHMLLGWWFTLFKQPRPRCFESTCSVMSDPSFCSCRREELRYSFEYMYPDFFDACPHRWEGTHHSKFLHKEWCGEESISKRAWDIEQQISASLLPHISNKWSFSSMKTCECWWSYITSQLTSIV